MTKTLGIDYGRAKIGIAINEEWLAQPLEVIKVKNWDDALEKIVKVILAQKAALVVVGVTEGEMGKEQERFAHELEVSASVTVVTQDEDLSTQDSQQRALDAGIPRKKRQRLEDAFAASLMLQSYLDSHSK